MAQVLPEPYLVKCFASGFARASRPKGTHSHKRTRVRKRIIIVIVVVVVVVFERGADDRHEPNTRQSVRAGRLIGCDKSPVV